MKTERWNTMHSNVSNPLDASFHRDKTSVFHIEYLLFCPHVRHVTDITFEYKGYLSSPCKLFS